MNPPDSKIDLHGCRRSEIRLRLLPFLDKGYAQNWEIVHIVHGKGEGILREYIWDLLSDLSYVESFRSGKYHEGGAGITVVKYRRENH